MSAPGGVWSGGVYLVPGGVPGLGGCLLPGGVPGPGGCQVPPPVNRMTNRCKNITLPQTSFAGGNKVIRLRGVGRYKLRRIDLTKFARRRIPD